MARILIVDDEPDAQELLAEFARRKGYTAIVASNGKEAIQLVKEQRPHVVFLDIRMPGMDGLAVLKAIREIDQEAGVIMITAVHEEATGREALRLGAVEFITKPIDFHYLERCVWHTIALMTL
jgi:DNA-binding response OmpR family regulator